MANKNVFESRSFEENLVQLEKIISEMEKQDISLDRAIQLYEDGLKLSSYLNNLLTNYEGKIKILEKNYLNGKSIDSNAEENSEEKATNDVEEEKDSPQNIEKNRKIIDKKIDKKEDNNLKDNNQQLFS